MIPTVRGSRAVALGCFDGFHRGHRSIVEKTVKTAARLCMEPAAFTFNRPPASTLYPSFSGILTGSEEKAELLREAGIQVILAADFESVRDMSAADFIERLLISELDAGAVVFGEDFTFGRGAEGNASTLRQVFGRRAIVVPFTEEGGVKISSRVIRTLISEGKVGDAARLLGRPYSLCGTRFEGRHDGRKLGFPTVNIYPDPEFVLPREGVYITEAVFSGGERFGSVTDVGTAPTLDATGRIRTETHILGTLAAGVPGSPMTLRFIRRLRDEKHFSSAPELAAAIAADVAEAEKYFNENPLR